MSSNIHWPWTENVEAVISLSFDDGLESQLCRAIPYMDRLGLSGTFYINPKEDYLEALPNWLSASSAGHEIGNHTCYHPCSRSLGRARGLELLTLADIEEDILLGESRLKRVFGDKKHTFCYPCYYHHVGEGASRQSYVPVVAKHFIAGRTGSCNRGMLVDPTWCDLACVESQACEAMTGYELIGLCERAANRRQWCILTFHGIQEGRLSVSDGDFQELCDHLAKHRKRFYVAPVVEVAQGILAARSATPRV
jgi:peptidoglycan-N-acetylglucosamine deacetylase